jgi:hypothetical protein
LNWRKLAVIVAIAAVLCSCLGLALAVFWFRIEPYLFSRLAQTQTSKSNATSVSEGTPPSTVTAVPVPSWSKQSLSNGLVFEYPSTWKVGVSERTQPDIELGEYKEVTIILTTDLPDKEGRLRWTGFSFSIYPNQRKLKLDEFVRMFFRDTDSLLILQQPSIKIGNAKNVISVRDDTAYRRRYSQVFPISPNDYFIETAGSVWRYSILYQNTSFDIRSIEQALLSRMMFPN